MAEPRVALVSMPFGAINTPSIQLGLLKAECREGGIQVNCFEFGLDFQRLIGAPLYKTLSAMGDSLLGEWIFAGSAFPEFKRAKEFPSRFEDYLAHAATAAGTTPEAIVHLHEAVAPAFVASVAAALAPYEIVGFTSSFQQNVASLAVARAVKAINPRAVTVFGGANFESKMGGAYMRAFSWIDVVVSGEADAIVAPLFHSLLEKGLAPPVPGVYQRGEDGSVPPDAGADRLIYSADLNTLPLPDYDDYFDRLAALKLNSGAQAKDIMMPFEASRGCWWGQKHHCTFCGLNGGGMAFRAKSPARVVDEIATLVSRYRTKTLNATDNIISIKGLDVFCALVKEQVSGVQLFFEVKANLKPDTIQMMAQAGITRMQPGIESFSDHVLALMRKGTTGINNVNALRWLAMHGVEASWNLLYGFPGETDSDYVEQLRLIKAIHHLEPPAGVAMIRIDRFSPNLENPQLRAKFAGLKPDEAYFYIYPEVLDYEQAAYYFRGFPNDPVNRELIGEIRSEIEEWRRKWGRTDKLDLLGDQLEVQAPFLYAIPGETGLEILDGRDKPAQPRSWQLDRAQREVYEAMFLQPISLEQLRARFPGTNLMTCLDFLERNALAYRIGDRFLALALKQALRPADRRFTAKEQGPVIDLL
jgi:ribosomal peptide maturation radical SAM protein 1